MWISIILKITGKCNCGSKIKQFNEYHRVSEPNITPKATILSECKDFWIVFAESNSDMCGQFRSLSKVYTT